MNIKHLAQCLAQSKHPPPRLIGSSIVGEARPWWEGRIWTGRECGKRLAFQVRGVMNLNKSGDRAYLSTPGKKGSYSLRSRGTGLGTWDWATGVGPTFGVLRERVGCVALIWNPQILNAPNNTVNRIYITYHFPICIDVIEIHNIQIYFFFKNWSSYIFKFISECHCSGLKLNLTSSERFFLISLLKIVLIASLLSSLYLL